MMKSMLQKTIRAIFQLIYPKLCFACAKSPVLQDCSICISCQYKITPTNYHQLADNPVLERFWGRVELQHASSSFEFIKGGLLQNLIHHLKYENRPEVGVELGKMHGSRLVKTEPYNSVDFIIPVPLHAHRKHKRGYNQAAMFAEGLSISMRKTWTGSHLIRTENTQTQTQKSRIGRFENVEKAFEVVSPERLRNKHLLLVDDVITTGATLEACAIKLLEVEGVKVSVVAIALAG